MRWLLFIFFGLGIVACQSTEKVESNDQETTERDTLYSQISKQWNQVLNAWYPRSLDTLNGGYLANWTYDWQQQPKQDKMIVTQARHLWTTSKVALERPQDSLYQHAARLGFDFLKDHMWDQRHGGFYWLVNRKGEPLLKGEGLYKKSYGHAFGIYALAAYAEAVPESEEVLKFAQESFRWLDEHAHDDSNGGYFSVYAQDGTPLTEEEQQADDLPVTWIYKEQNAGIHLMEAFTELYKVWPDSLVRERLIEMLHLVRDTMVTDQGHLTLYFTQDWTPISYADSSQVAREANYAVDHVSFGHDIETAFLMLDASEALGDFEYDRTLKRAKLLVDHTLKTGFDPMRSGIYERGYYLPGDSTITIIDLRKNWWSQAEGLNTLLMFSELYPKEKRYYTTFKKLWKYTNTFLIDHEYGDWYSYGLDVTPESQSEPKGHAWKGNYHNGRTLMSLQKHLRSSNR
uniref:AGE family epimerase/isomerase n=1 Tax=Roseihalotalea indica TaxID=2867963 RepID=A0AA49GM05_9BACT|nr:AGE family epimerase/isomerase [Tunicatimonas sp. TK19036]